MNRIIVWHKPTCSKCIDATQFLDSHGIIPDEWREYLLDVPTEDDIREVVKKSGLSASAFVRTHEPLYTEKYNERHLSDDEWITELHKHPELIHRPIIITANNVIIGRSEDQLNKLLIP